MRATSIARRSGAVFGDVAHRTAEVLIAAALFVVISIVFMFVDASKLEADE